MPTYKLTIAYEGTQFAGWQKQEPPDPAVLGEAAPRSQWVSSRKLEPGLVPGKPGRIALRTVQAVVERAVREVVHEPVKLQGASRTDAGVHARRQVAVFSCGGDVSTRDAGGGGVGALAEAQEAGGKGTHGSESRAAGRATTVRSATEDPATGSRVMKGWPVSRGVDRLLRAVNSRLADDVQVVAAEVVPVGFNPIKDCVGKGYSYSYWMGKHRPLWERGRVWHTWVDLDVAAMQRAANFFVGEHDFAGFAAAGHGRQTTVREVLSCELREVERRGFDGGERESTHSPESRAAGDSAVGSGASFAVAAPGRLLRLEISGNGFLYNMVRIIAGTLHDVGRGRLDAESVPDVIASLDRIRAGPTLPAEGLCLEWIRYREAGSC
jgi:tRNA pseudouridine38-40 synthase